MPNSDGSGTVDTANAVEVSKEEKCAPVVNGIHDLGKMSCHGNGNSVSINGDADDHSLKKAELSSITFPMKIIRKRHSDSEMFHENSKKSKIDSCDTPRSEPSPLAIDTPHDSMTFENETLDENEEKKLLPLVKKVSNGSIGKEETEEDSFSSIVCIDEEPRALVNNVQYKEDTVKSQSSDEKPSSPTVKEEAPLSEIKHDENDEKSGNDEAQSMDTGTQTTSDGISNEERKLLLRSEVLTMFSENLKRARSKSVLLFQKFAQSKTVQNNNWQSKYYHLHNRFLHLKVSTDKMIENVSKEDKESRSVEAQTEIVDYKDSKSLTQVAPQVSNGLTSNTQISNVRQTTSHSPAKSVASATSASSNPAPAANVPSVPASQPSNLQNSTTSNVPSSHPSSKSGSQPDHSPDQNVQSAKSQPSQPPSQQSQQVLLLSTRHQPSTLQDTQVVAIPSGGSNVIDLTDDDSSANPTRPPLRSAGVTTVPRTNSRQPSALHEPNRVRHPMALPRMTATTISHGCCRGLPPPSPQLTVTRTEDGVCLQWNIPNYTSVVYSRIKRYRLFNYSQTPQSVFYSFQNPWKEIGSVDAMDLPMACTLTQIQDNSVYHFAIRPVDEYERLGIWSNTATIEMTTLDS